MTTDTNDQQEAPEARTRETEDDDTKGHKFANATSDPDSANRQLDVHPAAAPDESHTEENV
jgi:hypothetical protein